MRWRKVVGAIEATAGLASLVAAALLLSDHGNTAFWSGLFGLAFVIGGIRRVRGISSEDLINSRRYHYLWVVGSVVVAVVLFVVGALVLSDKFEAKGGAADFWGLVMILCGLAQLCISLYVFVEARHKDKHSGW
jgi:drug/metabolite transporter (DMT)-like permease